jgi:hypothetical protein
MSTVAQADGFDDDGFDNEVEFDDTDLWSTEPRAYCIYCEQPLYDPEEVDIGFCNGGCEELFHQRDFE